MMGEAVVLPSVLVRFSLFYKPHLGCVWNRNAILSQLICQSAKWWIDCILAGSVYGLSVNQSNYGHFQQNLKAP
jgi:hypothetical protein